MEVDTGAVGMGVELEAEATWELGVRAARAGRAARRSWEFLARKVDATEKEMEATAWGPRADEVIEEAKGWEDNEKETWGRGTEEWREEETAATETATGEEPEEGEEEEVVEEEEAGGEGKVRLVSVRVARVAKAV